MLKVNDAKVLETIKHLQNQLAEINEKATANANRIIDVSDDFKDKLRVELFKEYSKEPQAKLDYLMTYVDDVTEPTADQPTE